MPDKEPPVDLKSIHKEQLKSISYKYWIMAGLIAFSVFIAFLSQFKSKYSSISSSSSSSSSSCVKEDWACAVEANEIKMRWGCEDQIKAGLKDPRSYQANDVNYWPSMSPDPALVMVKIDYTATNSFGGPVRGNAVCHADADGNILSSKYL